MSQRLSEPPWAVHWVMVELVLIAVAKNCSWDVSSDVRAYVVGYLNERGMNDLYALQREYNQAFGGSGTDGVTAMVDLLSEKLTDSRMSENTKQQFYVEFYAMLNVFFDDFKSMQLIG